MTETPIQSINSIKIRKKRETKFTKQIRLLLSEEMYNNLKDVADIKDTNVNQLVRDIVSSKIKEYLNQLQ